MGSDYLVPLNAGLFHLQQCLWFYNVSCTGDRSYSLCILSLGLLRSNWIRDLVLSV